MQQVGTVLTMLLALQPRGSGWNPARRDGGLYDTDTVETVRGTVVAVAEVPPEAAAHLALEVDDERLVVHLGPAWYVAGYRFRPGDVLEVTGSRVEMARQPVLVAAHIERGPEVFELRSPGGLPLWGAWRPR